MCCMNNSSKIQINLIKTLLPKYWRFGHRPYLKHIVIIVLLYVIFCDEFQS